MGYIDYRQLSRSELQLLMQIDRTEVIERIFHIRDGSLALEDQHCEVADWSKREKSDRIKRLQALYDRGATAFGAFSAGTLVGMAILEHRQMIGREGCLNLDGLWVSHGFRHQGIATSLMSMVRERARQLGARRLYVSATPSENTIGFYSRIGFSMAKNPDVEMYRREPEDIHMEMAI